MNLKIPKVREGGFVPSFIEHRKRGEQALISVIQEAVIQGVSTRKIEAVLAAFGIAGISAAQVSQLCSSPDEKVRRFRERPLGECRYVWVDALYEKVREDERVESMAVESKDFVWLRSRGAGGILDMLRRYPSSLCTFPKRIVRAAADHQSVPVEIQNV